MKKIVLDTDGVILNFGENYIQFAEKILGRKLNHNIVKYQLNELLQIPEKEADYIWDKFNTMNEWEKIPAFKNIDKAIEIIKDYNLEVYVVTSIDEKYKNSRQKNLNSIGLFPKEIICVGSNHGHKNKVISEINPIAFVDDRLDHLYRSQDIEHLVWIDQGQEQMIEFTDYHVKADSLYQWTSEFLPAIINKTSVKNENNKKRNRI